MDKALVSVIIPVYNVEDYVEKAVKSILDQTLTDWEMFLVDDGSSDSSGKICDRLSENEPRIKVIHQDNAGAAAARNAAIEKSCGKYLYFMDADDWAAKDMLWDMVELAENYRMDSWAGRPVEKKRNRIIKASDLIADKSLLPADGEEAAADDIKIVQELRCDTPDEHCAQLVIAGFYIETYYSEYDYYLQLQNVKARTMASKYEFRNEAHLLFDKNLLYTPWNKLYLASFIKDNDIRFPDMHWDDFTFNLQVIKNVSRVTVTDKAYYHFLRKRSDSESEKYNRELYSEREEENKKIRSLYDCWKKETQQEIIGLLEDRSQAGSAAGELPEVNIPSKEADEFIARRYVERIIGCIENITNPACDMPYIEKIGEIERIIHQDSVKEALKLAKPRSLYMKMMMLPVKMKASSLTYLEGKLISSVKSGNTKTFARLKANR